MRYGNFVVVRHNGAVVCGKVGDRGIYGKHRAAQNFDTRPKFCYNYPYADTNMAKRHSMFPAFGAPLAKKFCFFRIAPTNPAWRQPMDEAIKLASVGRVQSHAF